MSPDRTAWAARGMRLPRLSNALSPAAAMALFATASVAWLLTTRPGSSVRIIGSGMPFTLEQWVVLLSTVAGTAVLLGGLFVIGVYLLHWPEIKIREIRQQLELARAELADVQRTKVLLLRKLAEIQRRLDEIAAMRADRYSAEMGRAVASSLGLVDDLISELERAEAWSGAD
jgi:hypothetical protein